MDALTVEAYDVKIALPAGGAGFGPMGTGGRLSKRCSSFDVPARDLFVAGASGGISSNSLSFPSLQLTEPHLAPNSFPTGRSWRVHLLHHCWARVLSRRCHRGNSETASPVPLTMTSTQLFVTCCILLLQYLTSFHSSNVAIVPAFCRLGRQPFFPPRSQQPGKNWLCHRWPTSGLLLPAMRLHQFSKTMLIRTRVAGLCAGSGGSRSSSRNPSNPGSVGSAADDPLAAAPDFLDGLILSSTCFLLKSDARDAPKSEAACATGASLAMLGPAGTAPSAGGGNGGVARCGEEGAGAAREKRPIRMLVQDVRVLCTAELRWGRCLIFLRVPAL